MPIKKPSNPSSLARGSIIGLIVGILGTNGCQPSLICDQTLTNTNLKVAIFTYKCNTKIDSSYNQRFNKVYAINTATKDTLLYTDATRGYPNIELPLSNKTDSVTYILLANTDTATTKPLTIRETLKIRYTRRLHYISQGCGYVYYYQITSYSFSRRYFDFELLVDPGVSPDVAVNFKLYQLSNRKNCPVPK